ncbi:MAG: hypothetical protein L0241_25100 [Planctomycetia bacterium]|nr:hypothetical protein [Planctomycetia bacterium]
MIDWSTVFTSAKPKRGATEAEVAEMVATLGLPMSQAEVDYINSRQPGNPFPPTDPHHATWQPFDPAAWVMPANRPIPPSYLLFVRYSNGGNFQNGDRLFQMWGTGLRNFMLTYLVPQYMPLAVPFAFNGGVMYMFDMRKRSNAEGEYPIICAGAGCLTFDWDESPKVADSFPEVCRGRFTVERLRHGGIVLTAEQWATCRDPKPMLDECEGRHRKLRLFACACARRVWHLIPDKLFREAVELAEQFADVGLRLDKKRKALKEKCEARSASPTWTAATAAATNCLSTDASSAAWNGAWSAAIAEAGTHEGRKWKSARAKQADLIREIFGNPLVPVQIDPVWLKWNNRTVPQIANRIYDQKSFADMPVLTDALEEAGCSNAEILAHCRDEREHVRGCWVLDRLRDEPED